MHYSNMNSPGASSLPGLLLPPERILLPDGRALTLGVGSEVDASAPVSPWRDLVDMGVQEFVNRHLLRVAALGGAS